MQPAIIAKQNLFYRDCDDLSQSQDGNQATALNKDLVI
jgi:hypothetical protein